MIAREDAAKELNELDGIDEERDHIKADQIILDRLSQYEPEVVEAFLKTRNRIGFCYS